MSAPLLFTPITIPAPAGAGIVSRNRAFVAPMCQYAIHAADGVPTDWHLQNLGSFAAGGFGLVMTEATAVTPEARISPGDVGLWNDEQTDAHARLVRFTHGQGALAGVQLAHAGGKASTYPALPGFGTGTVPPGAGGWQTVGVADGPVLPSLAPALALDEAGIAEVVASFAAAARRALAAGYDVVQIHGAHGYLLHQFCSPLTNTRTDRYGGSEENRTRLVREVVDAVRAVWPDDLPLGIRLSATDWVDSGWDVEANARLARSLVEHHGVTWVDASSGGLTSGQAIPVAPGYQVPLATRIHAELAGTGAIVSAVGLIEGAVQAETILVTGQADAVSIGRAALRNPHWAAAAASELGVLPADNPQAPQYARSGY